MYCKKISNEMLRIWECLKARTKECVLTDIFNKLPDYYDSDSVKHPFLAELVLVNLELPPEPSGNRIDFVGTIKNTPEFLKETLCFEEVVSSPVIACSVEENDYGEIVFSGAYSELNGIEKKVAQLSLLLDSLRFSSGTTEETLFSPKFEYDCRIQAQSKVFDCGVVQMLGINEFQIELKEIPEKSLAALPVSTENGVSAKDLLTLFGITDVSPVEYIPSEISSRIFEDLTLKSISITSTKEKMQVLFADVVTKNPITLLENKIQFTPGLYFEVNTSREYSIFHFNAYGELTIGESIFEIRVNPAWYEVSFGLKSGSKLDFAAVAKLFFPTLELPPLTFSRLNFSMNFHVGSWKIDLGTQDILKFSVASKELAIESILLQVAYNGGSFFVGFSGEFDICGVSLQVFGKYYGGSAFDFSCCLMNNSISLSSLLQDFFGSSCLIGDSFDFTVTTLSFRCRLREESSFCFQICARFCGTDDTLKQLFSLLTGVEVTAVKKDGQWNYGITVSASLELGESHVITCSYQYDSTSQQNENKVLVSYHAETPDDVVTFGDVLKTIGFDGIEESWSFITQVGISEVTLQYDFTQKQFYGKVTLNSGGSIELQLKFKEKTEYKIAVVTTLNLSFGNIPIIGGLANKFSIDTGNFCIRDISVYVQSEADKEHGVPAGVALAFTVFGKEQLCQIYEAKTNCLITRSVAALSESETSLKTFWIKLEKNIAIFSLHRIGLGLDNSYLVFLIDASLNVSPLQFDLIGAGIGVNISDFALKFYISGFGISFSSDAITISGSLMKEGNSYAGLLTVQTKPFSLFAAAQYDTDGSLFAYAVLSANLGGPPAFFILGLALGFGYNKRLVLPDIEQVSQYPLVEAACGEIDTGTMLSKLQEVIVEESGQKFLCFGIKFSTFEIAYSFVLLSIEFGNETEIGLLGRSDITMPPNCKGNIQPIAHAQLALKASLKPSEGFFGIEARLTSESYILSKDCHLTGGFAFYMWFGGEHAGDFVITLGGYHPKYQTNKPAHYPDVPRVGFNWKIGNYVNIDGEAYFALTPSVLMAGGRLSITYTLGRLKAYFIAKADFLIGWKPFHYDADVSVTIGASYRLELWFVSKTITVELGADLHIWGPDFSASARIKFWILSFHVKFGGDAPQKAADLDWGEFCDSFLPKAETKKEVSASGVRDENNNLTNASATEPFELSYISGLTGKVTVGDKEYYAVSSNGAEFSVETVMPVSTASLNGTKIEVKPVTACVKPMGKGGDGFQSTLSVTISGNTFSGVIVTKNMPSALWGGNDELLKDVPCGIHIYTVEPQVTLFPQKHFISLEDLYQKGTQIIEHAFADMDPGLLPSYYTDKDTISIFANTVNAKDVSEKRTLFLKELGIEDVLPISMEKYAAGADNYLDEEVWIPVYGEAI